VRDSPGLRRTSSESGLDHPRKQKAKKVDDFARSHGWTFYDPIRTEPEKNGNVRRNFGGSLAREEYLIH